MKDRFLLTIAILCISSQLIAQELRREVTYAKEGLTDIESFNSTYWKVYDTLNSILPNNCILSLAIEENKALWIGTSDYFGEKYDDDEAGGLVSYDGTNWNVYNIANSALPSNTVYTIVIDTSGTKWIGTGFAYDNNSGNLAAFDDNNWSIYNASNSSLGNQAVWSLAIEENGTKWIGSGYPRGGWETQGLVSFDGDTWTIYDTNNSSLPGMTISSIAIDNDGTKWISPTGCGLVSFDGFNWSIYNTQNSGLPSNYILPIAIDRDGTKWIGTSAWRGGLERAGGLVSYDGNNWTVYNTLNSGLPDNAVSALAIDNNGTKWIGTWYGGLASFDGTNWKVYDTLNSGLPDNSINSIVIDRYGTKWIGTWNGGLAAFNENGISEWTNVDETTSQTVHIYPNPAEDYIHIQTNLGSKIMHIEIIDIEGQLIDKQYHNTNSVIVLDITPFAKGFYVINTYTETEIISSKLVVK